MSSRHIASGKFGGDDRASSSKVIINSHEAAPVEEIQQCGSNDRQSPRDNKGSTVMNTKQGSTVNGNTEYSIIGYEDPIKLNERCVTFNVYVIVCTSCVIFFFIL